MKWEIKKEWVQGVIGKLSSEGGRVLVTKMEGKR